MSKKTFAENMAEFFKRHPHAATDFQLVHGMVESVSLNDAFYIYQQAYLQASIDLAEKRIAEISRKTGETLSFMLKRQAE